MFEKARFNLRDARYLMLNGGGDVAAALFDRAQGRFRPAGGEFVQHRPDRIEAVVCPAQEDNQPQAHHLPGVVEAIAVLRVTRRRDDALRFPEAEGGRLDPDCPGGLPNAQRGRRPGIRTGPGLVREVAHRGQREVDLPEVAVELGVPGIDDRQAQYRSRHRSRTA